MVCWKCHEGVQGPVWVGCGAIQPPRPDADYFDVLGLERRYHLDGRALEKAFRAVSRKVHPDRFTKRAAVERRMSLQWTATVNTARRVLKDPVTRAHYLATGKARPPERGGPQPDPDFLEEMFELQSEARSAPEAVRERVNTLRAELDQALEARFTAWEAGEGDLESVDLLLAHLRYLATAERLVDQS